VSRRRGASTLARRLRRTLLAVGLLQLLVLGLALLLLQQVQQEQQRVTDEYFSTVQDSNAGFLSVFQIQQAASGYLSSGDAEELARLRAAQQPRPGAVSAEELQRRLSDAPEALAALGTVRELAQSWFAGTEPLVQAVEAGGPAAVTPAQRDQQRGDFVALRESFDDYIDAVLAARSASAVRLDEQTRLLFGAVLLVVVTSLVAGAGLYVALRRWVTLPLDALAAEARTVRSGALDHEVRVDGPPEILALSSDVEAMRRGLVDQLAAVERTQQALELQTEELRRSNRDLEQFAYVASHDLQEPLRKVSSFCQMLERRYKGQLDERADQYIAFAVDGAKRMQLLINDLLAFSRVGRISEGFTEVAMDSVLSEALRNLSTALEETGGTVTASPLPVVRGERRLLVQLVQNLVGNALKFRGEDPPDVRLDARRDGDLWEFTVSDNGIGIEPQYADRIFVIFQRLHAKSEYDGTGIGLSLCKKIVEHHGGTIRLDQTGGPGATFRWTLPVEAPPQPAPAGADDEAPAGAEQEAAWSTT
jgi:signal transduction histidine kinase